MHFMAIYLFKYHIAPKNEILRLKKNWFFVAFVLPILDVISYTYIFSSLHQFITNPQEDSINRSKPGMEEVFVNLFIMSHYTGDCKFVCIYICVVVLC